MRETSQDNLVYLPRPPVVLKRGRPKRPFRSMNALVYAVFFLLLAYLFFLLTKNFLVYRHLVREKQRLVQTLKDQKAELKNTKDREAALARDDYLEAQARRRLGLVKKDEIVYKIVRKNQPRP